MSAINFIKNIDYNLYKQYLLESFGKPEKKEVDINQFVTKPVFKNTVKLDEIKITDLPSNHKARQYLENRKVPLKDLYYTDDFSSFVKKHFFEYDKKLYNEPRIIIPFYDQEHNLMGVQGRAIGQSKIKYITIKHENYPKVFGLDKIDLNKTIYVVEGPIDSLFLNNSIAMMDAALYRAGQMVGIDNNYVFIYDNERRNSQILSNMRKTINMGYNICIWPDYIDQKDINDMVLNGMHQSEIQHIIDKNTFNGLQATMKFNLWSRE